MSKNANTKLTLSQKIAQLDKQVDWFYGEDFSLDQAVAKYQTALKLAKEIEQDLQTLQNKIEVLDKNFAKD